MNVAWQTGWDRVRVLGAQVHQSIGWAGISGAALIVGALVVAVMGWSARQDFAASAVERHAVLEATNAAARRTPVRANEARPAPDLPRRADVPLLLTQMEQAAIGNGLLWPAADYRIIAATSTQPATLEVRCALKGSYPKVRAMLVQLMSSVPAFSLRQFAVSRPNADAADVEAKVVLAVFLADDAGQLAEPAPTEATR